MNLLVQLQKAYRHAKEQLCNEILEAESEPKIFSKEGKYAPQVTITFMDHGINLQLHHLETLLESFDRQAQTIILESVFPLVHESTTFKN